MPSMCDVTDNSGVFTSFRKTVEMGFCAFIVCMLMPASSFGISEIKPVASDSASANGAEAYYESARAESKKHQSLNGFTQTLTTDEINLFGAVTAEQALYRLTGVRESRDGNPVFRGLSEANGGLLNLSINGHRLASTGAASRFINVSGLSAEMLDRLEYKRVVTPDQNASSVNGALELSTRQPIGEGRGFSVVTGGGFQGGQSELLSPDTRAALNYSEQFESNVDLTAGLYQNRSSLSFEQVGIDFGTADFGNGPEDVIRSLSPAYTTRQENNIGGYFHANINTGQIKSWYVSGFVNNRQIDDNQYSLVQNTGDDWISPNETGAMGNRGTLDYRLGLDENSITQTSLHAGGDYSPGSWGIRYRGGWSFGGFNGSDLTIPFRAASLNYEIDPGDRSRPVMQIVGDEPADNNLLLQEMNETRFRHDNHIINAGTDFDFHFEDFTLTTGLSAVRSGKTGSYRNSNLRLLANASVASFRSQNVDKVPVLGNDAYGIRTFINPNDARGFVGRNYSLFRKDPRNERLNSDIFNYEAVEFVYAGYVMGRYSLGNAELLAGVRAELTDAEYTGADVLFNDIGNHAGTVDTTKNQQYLNLFPNFQLRYRPAGNLSVQAAYSRTIARQDYSQLSPFSLRNIERQTLFKGNASLDPILSDNLDLEIGFSPAGQTNLTVGGFYKRLSGFVFQQSEIIENQEGISEEVFFFINSTVASSIKGIEFTWEQQFRFLPGFLSNFMAYGNYAWTTSSFNTPLREEAVDFTSQSPHIVNAALGYIGTRFTSQVTIYYASDALIRLAENSTMMPSIGNDVFGDTETEGIRNLSVSVRYQLFGNLQIWGDALNLIQEERTEYIGSAGVYPERVVSTPNRLFQLGLRLDL